MKILVLNCGSSSVKYQLIEMEDEEVICKGIVERIGGEGIRALALGPRDVRFVTHRDVDGPDVDRALEAAARALA